MSIAVKKQSRMSQAIGNLPCVLIRSFTAIAISFGAIGLSFFLVGLVWLALITLVLGIFPATVISYIDAATRQLLGTGLADKVREHGWWMLAPISPERASYEPLIFLATIAAAVLLGFWLERNALVWPSLVPADGGAWFGAIQLGIAAGFLGAFVLVFLVFSRIFPTLPLPASDRH